MGAAAHGTDAAILIDTFWIGARGAACSFGYIRDHRCCIEQLFAALLPIQAGHIIPKWLSARRVSPDRKAAGFVISERDMGGERGWSR